MPSPEAWSVKLRRYVTIVSVYCCGSTPEMIASIDRSKSGEVVFTKSKSILLKTMKIRRIYDAETQTLLYISYSTKETTGSFKHSLSTIPLWGTAAWKNRPPVPAKSM